MGSWPVELVIVKGWGVPPTGGGVDDKWRAVVNSLFAVVKSWVELADVPKPLREVVTASLFAVVLATPFADVPAELLSRAAIFCWIVWFNSSKSFIHLTQILNFPWSKQNVVPISEDSSWTRLFVSKKSNNALTPASLTVPSSFLVPAISWSSTSLSTPSKLFSTVFKKRTCLLSSPKVSGWLFLTVCSNPSRGFKEAKLPTEGGPLKPKPVLDGLPPKLTKFPIIFPPHTNLVASNPVYNY